MGEDANAKFVESLTSVGRMNFRMSVESEGITGYVKYGTVESQLRVWEGHLNRSPRTYDPGCDTRY